MNGDENGMDFTNLKGNSLRISFLLFSLGHRYSQIATLLGTGRLIELAYYWVWSHFLRAWLERRGAPNLSPRGPQAVGPALAWMKRLLVFIHKKWSWTAAARQERKQRCFLWIMCVFRTRPEDNSNNTLAFSVYFVKATNSNLLFIKKNGHLLWQLLWSFLSLALSICCMFLHYYL